MGGIAVGGGGSGKKSVDSEIPLVPFIDLLLCCVMFLLVTAVWNQLARINASQQTPSENAPEDTPPPEEDKIKLFLRVRADGYSIESTAGDKTPIPKKKGEYDLAQLEEKLEAKKKQDPSRKDIIVAPEDGVAYQEIIKAMDAAVGKPAPGTGEGTLFPKVAVRDGGTLTY